MATRTCSAVLTGVRAHLIEIETSIRPGLAEMILTGLPDTALRETRDRVRAAIVNSGQPWPGQIITTCLYPASLPGHGSALDAAIAVSILAAAGLVPGEAAAGVFWFAELGLDGRLRPVRGVLPAVLAAQSAGCRIAVVAPGNAAEAALADGVTVTSMQTLAEVITWLREDGPAREVISLSAARDTHGAVTGGSTVADPARDDAQQTAAAAGHGDNVTTARSSIAEPPRTVNRLPVVDWRPRPARPGELPGQFYVVCLCPDATGDRPFIVWTVAYDPRYQGGTWVAGNGRYDLTWTRAQQVLDERAGANQASTSTTARPADVSPPQPPASGSVSRLTAAPQAADAVTAPADGDHRQARAWLTYLAEPADPILGALIRVTDPAYALNCIKDDAIPAGLAEDLGQPGQTLRRALAIWRNRLGQLPGRVELASYGRDGIRILCPGDQEWPGGLDSLGDTSPYALWVRGGLDLRVCCARSIAIVGSRAASGYGAHMAGEIAADLAESGWLIVSGGAYVL